MRVCIHQPDFFPWLGLINKIAKTEHLIFLDNVQATLGKSWLTRNRLLYNNETKWITLPTYKELLPIRDIKINHKVNIKRKHLGLIRSSYAKTPYFKIIYPMIEDIYSKDFEKLIDFNTYSLKTILNKLSINTKITFASDYVGNKFPPKLTGNDLILELAKLAKA